MVLEDMITVYRGIGTINVYIEIRNKQGYSVCTTEISSQGVLPYKQAKVTEWFITGYNNDSKPRFVVYLDM